MLDASVRCRTCMHYRPTRSWCLHHELYAGPESWCNAHTLRAELAGVAGLSGGNPERLTLRNRIVEMFRSGQNVAQIAEALKLTTQVVEGHLRKAGALQDVVQAAANQPTEAGRTSPPSTEVMRESDATPEPSTPSESTIAVRRAPTPKGIRTEDIVAAIRRGESWSQIAHRFGVSAGTIQYHARRARQLGLLEPRAKAAGQNKTGGATTVVRFVPAAKLATTGAPNHDALVLTLRLPVDAHDLRSILQAVEAALPDRTWSVEGAGTEMRLIGRRREQEARAARTHAPAGSLA